MSPRVGVRFEPDWPPEDLPEFARWAEESGYHELWFSEDLPWAGGIAMAATALANTTHLRVGFGLLPALTRNVATVAMEIAALARIAPGRLIVGLGLGLRAWMEQIGAATSRRNARLEEVVTALSGLLAGDEVSVSGHQVQLDQVRLGHPPTDPPPLLLGTTGPLGLAIAARWADGVVLPEVSGPAAVRWVRSQMSATGAPGSTALLAMASIDDDRDRALAQVRGKIQRILDFGIYPRLMEVAGLQPAEAGGLSDADLRSMTLAGTPADCVGALGDWADAGVSSVVLVAGDDDPLTTYARFAREVLPMCDARLDAGPPRARP